MNVALFTDTFFPQVNGVANTVYRYANALAREGHTVRVYTVSAYSEQELTHLLSGAPFSVKVLPSIPLLVYPGERIGLPWGSVTKDIQSFKPDIIHTHTPFSMGHHAYAAARAARVPLVGTHHTFLDHYLKHVYLDFQWSKKVAWDLTIRYYNNCAMVVSPSRSLASYFEEYKLARPLTVLPNILDTDFFSPKETREASPHKTLIYMGRLSYEKNIKGVIDAAALVMKQMPGTTLLLVGDGSERTSAEAYIREKGMAQDTTITGFLHGYDLVNALRSGDVFLMASKSENMPLALMEAMAVGLPIVAAKSLGLQEMLEDGGNAYLTRPDDPEMMAARALELLRDDSLRQQFSARSRALSLAYSETEVIKKVEALYERVIAEAH